MNVLMADVEGFTEAADSGGILVGLYPVNPPLDPPTNGTRLWVCAEHHLDRLVSNSFCSLMLLTIWKQSVSASKQLFLLKGPDLHPLLPGSDEQRSFLDGGLMVSEDQSLEIKSYFKRYAAV